MPIYFAINILSGVLFLIGLFYLLRTFILGRNGKNIPVPNNIKNPKYCILVPARNESRVIEGLLKSIKSQSLKINMKDVFVIVESDKDKTVEITKKYGSTIFVRKDLENKRRKGYALDECIKYILGKKKSYDAYFILDADNELEKDFLYEMDKSFKAGYDIVLGYRNTKNGNSSVIAACSVLVFSLVNTICNLYRNKHNKNIIISGTGFYIKGTLIEEWKGFPFNSLTEDYELSLYATLHSLTTFYNEDAKSYDEQPTSMEVSMTQKVRWVKGYLTCRKMFRKELQKKSKEKGPNRASLIASSTGIGPYLYMIAGALLYLIVNYISFILGAFVLNTELFIRCFRGLMIVVAVIYIVLLVVSAIMLINEEEKLNLKTSMRIKAAFFNPIYLAQFIPCLIEAFFKKEIEWKEIDHSTSDFEKVA